MPTLYVVSTPIGNLEDITLRALRTLREVKLIAAEDTRKTKRLLSAYGISTPMTSYYEHNKQSKLGYILGILEKEDVALVSEAGTPGLSDPGYELIVAASERGIPIVPIPGPAVIAVAMAVSGLPLNRVLFIGFLPHRASARRKMIECVIAEPGTMVALESPHRLRAGLKDILELLGDRRIAVCREMTKIHEEVFRGTVSQAIAHFQEPKGEFTLVIQGYRSEEKAPLTEDIKQRLYQRYTSGITAREAVGQMARETGVPRKELYQTWLQFRREKELTDPRGV